MRYKDALHKNAQSFTPKPAGKGNMKTRTASIGLLSASVAALLFAAGQPAAAQQVRVDADDIGGVVTGAKGPEAGVWVIAETKDLPTKYVKIVVTDDQGATCCPIFPKPITTSGCAAMAWSIHRR
jgi:hypothetical protein